MTRVFESLGRLIVRHPRRTIGVWIALTALGFGLAIFGVTGTNLFDRLTTGEPNVPGSDSQLASQLVSDASIKGAQLTLVLDGVPVDAAGVAEAMAPAHEELAAIPGVATVIDPLVLPDGPANPAAAPLIATDGNGFLVIVELDAALDEDAEATALTAVEHRLADIPADLADVAPDARGIVGGETLIIETITEQVEKDLTTGEAIALPIALLVMVFVFGGFLAASIPMAGAIASIGGGLGVLLGFSYFMDLEASVVNIVTILGLGLSIDYGLLIVSRFREELHRLVDGEEAPVGNGRRRRGDRAVTTALMNTMATAGRTVAFSALTVAIAISGLLVFQPQILRSFGLASVAVILIAIGTALTLVPAMLAVFGRKLIKPGFISRIPGLRSVLARTADVESEEGIFSSLTARVQRRPWWVLGGVLLALGVLTIPLTHLELRNSTTELLPGGSVQRDYIGALVENYPAATSPAVVVVAQTTLENATAWSAELATLDNVASVEAPIPLGSDVLIGIRPDTLDAGSKIARDVVLEVRDLDPGFQTLVGGQAAGQIDFADALVDRAPWAAGIVILATFVLLFLMTGSVVIPIKALLTNVLSLAASLGVLVWVFQDGNLSGVLGFISTGGIETYVVALVIAFAFGLAMDYEVFLLSRIKELHDAGYSNNDSVRLGLQRSGRIITSAATIIVVVFTGFVFGELLVIKEVGFSLAVAVFIDATLVRLLLVPATMTLLGSWNWWAPTFMTRIYEKLAITH
ncbi:MMPL family transporter [Pengzhenrongella frigida]|uniref:MMPL family transporter n=1 Tax=Pengzhenrongella frigida TaxID=1259133 RepID=A0A4Q5N413_9MICO|nr:MMPL family transporter [Cellulomonas sp. HLT2-17]